MSRRVFLYERRLFKVVELFPVTEQTFIKSLAQEIKHRDGIQLADVLSGRPRRHRSKLVVTGLAVEGRRCQADECEGENSPLAEPPFYPVRFLQGRQVEPSQRCQTCLSTRELCIVSGDDKSVEELSTPVCWVFLSTTTSSCCQLVSINPVISV